MKSFFIALFFLSVSSSVFADYNDSQVVSLCGTFKYVRNASTGLLGASGPIDLVIAVKNDPNTLPAETYFYLSSGTGLDFDSQYCVQGRVTRELIADDYDVEVRYNLKITHAQKMNP